MLLFEQFHFTPASLLGNVFVYNILQMLYVRKLCLWMLCLFIPVKNTTMHKTSSFT